MQHVRKISGVAQLEGARAAGCKIVLEFYRNGMRDGCWLSEHTGVNAEHIAPLFDLDKQVWKPLEILRSGFDCGVAFISGRSIIDVFDHTSIPRAETLSRIMSFIGQ